MITSQQTRPGALVQGASRGIGLALVELLLNDTRFGRVVATCRDPAGAGALAALHEANRERLLVLPLDVTEEQTIAAAASSAADAVGQLALVINSAGLLHDATLSPERRLDDIDAANLQRLFAVNAIGPLLVAKHFAGLFDPRARSVLANLSARVGSIGDNGLGGWYGYRASKAAQNMFTRTLAIELRRRNRGIICVALHPGTVDTGLSVPFQRRVPSRQLFDSNRAARQLLNVIDSLDESANGGFYAWDGAEIPW